jgi:predicted O-methyltransferase YrrM
MSLLGPTPAWVEGGLSTEDVDFLVTLVRELAPRIVVEIGVGAGTSSAALLFALDWLPEYELRYLFSADIQPTCYFDARRRTGAAVAEMYSVHRALWNLDAHTDARRLAETFEGGSVDLGWIDADHRHPWALFDLLYLAPVMRPQAWIALHDIDLPRLYPQFPSHGPMWLFEAWPFERRVSATSTNIGAVRLPDDLGALVPMALELLRRPLEAPHDGEGLAPVFAPVEAAARRLARPAGRPRGVRHRP